MEGIEFIEFEDLSRDTGDRVPAFSGVSSNGEDVFIDFEDVDNGGVEISGGVDNGGSLLSTSNEVIKEAVEEASSVGSSEDYKGVLLELMDRGILERFDMLEIDDNEVLLSDMDSLDKDVFSEIISNHIKSVKENSVEMSGLSEVARRMVELDKQGINISNVLEEYRDSVGAIKDLDLSDESNQIALLMYDLIDVRGNDKGSAEILIEGYRRKGELAQRSSEVKSRMEEVFMERTREIERKVQENKRQFEESIAKDKVSYNDYYSKLGLDKNYSKKVVEMLTSYDEIDGRLYSKMDLLYSELRKDPEKMGEMALFLFDRDKFLDIVTSKAKNETKLSEYKKVRISNSGRSGSNATVKVNKEKDFIIM